MKYSQYIKDQITRAESKWGRKPDFDEIFKQTLRLTIDQVDDYIKNSRDICCMGCRQGTEVFEFKERYPNAKVHGIDITKNIDTIKTHLSVHIELQDFNKLPDDWDNKFDLVFSNSIDHAFNPTETLQEWYRVTRDDGYLLIEFSTHPATNIEHSFSVKDLPNILPSKQFKHVLIWESPERQLITGLFEVIK